MTPVKPPLQIILKAIPGRTVAEQARLCEVSRQSFHNWKNGKYRPGPKQAMKIARLTGYTFTEIIGLD